MNTPRLSVFLSRQHDAFSLIELLAVVALVAVLAVASGTALTGLSDSGQSTKSLLTISETLEWAREYTVHDLSFP